MASTVTTDGRAARTSRTRVAIIEALAALVEEGEPQPNVAAIAARAGVSPRSVHSHFASVEDLHRALAGRTTERVVAMLAPIDPAGAFDERVEQMSHQRARVNEEIGALRRAAARRLATSPALALQRRRMRDASRAQVERIFESDLRATDPASRRRRVALVDSMLAGELWDILRAEHHLTFDEARLAIAEGTAMLLSGNVDGHEPRSTPSRVSAAAMRVADLDARAERIVAAIEEGGPSAPLAARLRDLQAERAVAEHELAEAWQSAQSPD